MSQLLRIIRSKEEYINLVNAVKRKHINVISNLYFANSAVDRPLLQNRLFYANFNDDLYIFIDEIGYYNLIFFVESSSQMPLFEVDKPIVIRLLGRMHKNEEWEEAIISKIENNGFVHQRSYINVWCNAESMLLKLKSLSDKADVFMERFGIDIIQPNKELIPYIRQLQNEIKSIPFYDIDYYTDAEMINASENGYLFAAVKRESSELCGVNYNVLNGRYVTGWIAICDKYKGVPGISISLHRKAAERDARNGKIKKTWIATDNYESLNYHYRIGFTASGEEMNIWMLNPKEGLNYE